jgi:hypothetical protein
MTMQATRETRSPLLLPLAVAAVGLALLLENFLLLGGFRVSTLLPLLLVGAGAWLLIRGDLGTRSARSFGITRGSVESALLEISAGAADVILGGGSREERLIEGQFARASRPDLQVDGVHAHLKFNRSRTPWFSFADWQMRLASDLPWHVLATTSLGQVNADLGGLIVEGATIATGLGDIRFVCPAEAFSALALRSAAGDIHVVVPPGQAARVHVTASRAFGVRVDETRYQQVAPGLYESVRPDPASTMVEIHVRGTFGDAYLG